MSPVATTARVLVGMEFDDAAQFDATVHVLKECVLPVLFSPSADGMYERSSP